MCVCARWGCCAGSTNLSFTEDVLKRYEAYGWHTQTVSDGNAAAGGLAAAVAAARAVTDKPSIIKVRTAIGFGSGKEGSHKVHGSPLGEDDLAATKAKFGFDPEAKFVVSDDVYAYYREAAQRGAKAHAAWDAMMARCVLRAWVESVCSSPSAPHELLAVPPAATPRPSPTRPLPSRAASVRVA